MDYVCPVEVEKQLEEAGEQLSMPPSSTSDLLHLLDKIEELLTFVGQAPSPSMQGALVPCMGSLIADELLRHSDVDVRISVSSCLCEIARITAPEPPYKDEIMKEIFQLTVMAFGKLSLETDRSYCKAVHILESVAKVKSCLLMLDLECDALIVEMFEQFLSTIRASHPHSVFSNMEDIMTLAIEESDEISAELLSLLLSHVRRESENISPIPWKLAEKVLRNCIYTLKPYSQTIMKLISSDPENYAEVVTSLCQNAYENDYVVKSATANSIQKRDDNILESGVSTKSPIHSQPKKQKYIDTLSVTGIPKKRDGKPDGSKVEDCHKHRFKGKELETSQINDKIRSRKKPSSEKDVAEGSRDKDSKDACDFKKYGKALVGHKIKVWWPLDQMFYEGAVFSYDPLEKKHKVLYADGDEEILDLRHEKWKMLVDMSPDQEKVADLPGPTTITAKHQKNSTKRKAELSLKRDTSKSPNRGEDGSTTKVLAQVDRDISGESENGKTPDSSQPKKRRRLVKNNEFVSQT